MKAEDYRCGNLITYNGVERKIYGSDLALIDNTEDTSTLGFRPIPLTEEWLPKLGMRREFDCKLSDLEKTHLTKKVLYMKNV